MPSATTPSTGSSTRPPMCCAISCCRRRPTCHARRSRSAPLGELLKAGRLGNRLRAVSTGNLRRCSTCSPNRPPTTSTAGSRASWSRPARLRRHRRQLRQPVHARHRLCAAAPRLRRGERQEAALGPCDRRHGGDHAGDGARRREPRRRDRDRCGGAGGPDREGPRCRRRARGRARHARPQRSPPTSIPSCSIPRWSRTARSIPTFLRRMQRWRCGSGTFRMNVALSRAAELYGACPGATPADHHTAGIILAPSLGYMERAYDDARAHGWSREPIVEMLIPSTLDDTLAPRGAHVASLFCQHVAPELPGRRSWDDHRETVADLMIETVERYAPGFKASVIGRQALSPLDLEAGVRAHRRRHLPRRVVARSAVLGAADARLCRLSRTGARPLSLRRRAPIRAAASPARPATMRRVRSSPTAAGVFQPVASGPIPTFTRRKVGVISAYRGSRGT